MTGTYCCRRPGLGSRTVMRAPPLGRVVDRDRSSVGGDDVVGDRDPEAGAAVARAACLVESRESFEDREPVDYGDSWAVVVDHQLDATLAVAQCHRCAPPWASRVALTAGCARHVQSCERLPSTSAPETPDMWISTWAVWRCWRTSSSTTTSMSTIDRSASSPTRVVAGEEQQVVDKVLHDHHVVECAAARRLQVVGVVGEVDFERGSHPRRRGPELVRCVADELTLTGGRFLQSGEHLVHRRRQPVDLVTGSWLRDAPARVDRGRSRRPRAGSPRPVGASDRPATTPRRRGLRRRSAWSLPTPRSTR